MGEVIARNEQQTFGTEIVKANPSAIASAEMAKAKIHAGYQLALAKPRNEEEARAQILKYCKKPLFAERVEYGKPIKQRNDETGKWEWTKLRGPSIRFAETAIRLWQNIRTDVAITYEDSECRRVAVTVTDLETNASWTRETQVSKTVERAFAPEERIVLAERKNSKGKSVYLLRATDDEMDLKTSAVVSKTIRNEGLRLIPSDIIDEAIEEARKTLASRSKEDPDREKRRVVDGFMTLGLSPKHLEEYLGHSLDTITPPEIDELRILWKAIDDGEVNWADSLEMKKEKDAEKKASATDPAPAPAPHKGKKEKAPEADTIDMESPEIGQAPAPAPADPSVPEFPLPGPDAVSRAEAIRRRIEQGQQTLGEK